MILWNDTTICRETKDRFQEFAIVFYLLQQVYFLRKQKYMSILVQFKNLVQSLKRICHSQICDKDASEVGCSPT